MLVIRFVIWILSILSICHVKSRETVTLSSATGRAGPRLTRVQLSSARRRAGARNLRAGFPSAPTSLDCPHRWVVNIIETKFNIASTEILF